MQNLFKVKKAYVSRTEKELGNSNSRYDGCNNQNKLCCVVVVIRGLSHTFQEVHLTPEKSMSPIHDACTGYLLLEVSENHTIVQKWT